MKAHLNALHVQVLPHGAIAVEQEVVDDGERRVGAVHEAPQVSHCARESVACPER